MSLGTVRFGLYGCNMYRTKDLIDAVLAGCPGQVEITAGFDVNTAMLKACEERYGIKACTTLEAFLAEDFDVALISLPPFLHPGAFEACARAGKDVYLEKPVCIDAAGREQVLATAAAYPQVRCYVGLSYRHVAVFQKVAEIARRPEAGRIVGIHHHWFSPGAAIPPEKRTNWRHKLEEGGGQLVNHCCHLMDWLEWVGGPLKEVSATSYTHPGASLQHEEQEVSAAFVYGSGAPAVFNLSQHSHQNVQFGSIHLENLAIRYEWNQLSYVKVYRTRSRAADETYEWTVTSQAGDGGELDRNVSQMREFVSAYLAGAAMPQPLSLGVRAFDLACGIRQSYRERRRVAL